LKAKDTVAGPWIEDDRWFVQKNRGIVSAEVLLKSVVRSGGAKVGVAPLIVKPFKKKARILQGNELVPFFSGNLEFARFMRTFLAGRPAWLV